MCLVKDNFSSMITPKNFVKLTGFKEILLRLISILVCLSRALRNITECNFSVV